MLLAATALLVAAALIRATEQERPVATVGRAGVVEATTTTATPAPALAPAPTTTTAPRPKTKAAVATPFTTVVRSGAGGVTVVNEGSARASTGGNTVIGPPDGRVTNGPATAVGNVSRP